MSGWGIADTAPKIEKIKSESVDYLHGLNSCGIISWSTYSDMFDFYEDLIEKAYAQGKEDACPKTEERTAELAQNVPNDELISKKAVIDLAHELIVPNEYKYGLYNQAINNYCVEIIGLPPAQPEPTHMKIGKSKSGITMWYECEHCGEPVDIGDKFCHNCGRRFTDERSD